MLYARACSFLPLLATYTAVGMISRVRHKQTGAEYALKTIQLDKISSSLAKEMRNEIEILKRLDHPNIIRKSLRQSTIA